jgi:hypothetical protein
MILVILRFMEPEFANLLSQTTSDETWAGIHSRCGVLLVGFGAAKDALDNCKK